MPVFKTAPNIMQIVVSGLWTNGKKMVTVNHFECPGLDIDDAEAGPSVAKTVGDAWQDQIVEFLPNNYTFLGTAFLSLNSAEGNSGVIGPTAGKPIVGSSSTTSQTPNTAFLVTKLGSGGGRRARTGRMYLPPPLEADIDEDGRLSGPALVSAQGNLTEFYDIVKSFDYAPNDATATYVVPHWFQDDKPADDDGPWPASGFSVVTGLRVDPLVATQRRRMR